MVPRHGAFVVRPLRVERGGVQAGKPVKTAFVVRASLFLAPVYPLGSLAHYAGPRKRGEPREAAGILGNSSLLQTAFPYGPEACFVQAGAG